ncbi:hypothetical protein [uncultured Tateyamaria sp.]|uniref:hypothetical protein n=1 Tax=uncultured Tateyamaria sp. TaxID=455651 RepID=UPI0026305FBD|nr:hypothetical protein [uncultured Tateyamaria sp.]
MPCCPQQFLQQLADAFRAGRLDDIADSFAYPMPFYACGGMVVFGSTATLAEALALYRDASIVAGVDRIVPRIVAQGIMIRGYANMWVEWDHLDAKGTCLRTSQVRYVFFQADGMPAPVIEMVDYTVQAFPDLNAQLPLARTA